MTTVDLTYYPPVDKEFIFFSIREKLAFKYMVRFNSNNELTVYIKDDYFATNSFPFPFSDDVKYLYCQLDTREEMLEYIILLTKHDTFNYPYLPYTHKKFF